MFCCEGMVPFHMQCYSCDPVILSTFDFLTTALPFPLVHGACESLGMRILYYKDSGIDKLFGFKFVISQLIGGFLLTSPNKPMRNVLWPKFQPYIYWLYHTLDFNGVQYSYLWAYTSQSEQKTVQLVQLTNSCQWAGIFDESFLLEHSAMGDSM